MNKNNTQFKRKLKQFKKLIKDLENNASEKVKRALRRTYYELSFKFPSPILSKTIAASAIAIALISGNNIHAQQLKAPVKNPFSITDNSAIFQPEFIDIDNDGDKDIMTTDYYGSHQFYRNTGSATAPNFTAPQTDPFGLSGSGNSYTMITCADIDNDGDIDMMETSFDYYSGGTFSISFFENTGTSSAPAFAAPVVNPFGIVSDTGAISRPLLVDLDTDGDKDLLVMGFDYTAYNTNYYYYRNTGTASAPAFAAPVKNPFNMTRQTLISVPSFADADKDGDLDLFNGDYYGQLFMYRDTSAVGGNPAYSSVPVVNPYNIVCSDTGLRMLAFVDIDGDNDKDVFVSTSGGSSGYEYGLWFFQDTTSHVGVIPVSERDNLAKVYPSIFDNELQIELVEEGKSLIQIFDLFGKEVYLLEVNQKHNSISLAHLASGTYLVRIEQNGTHSMRKVIKK